MNKSFDVLNVRLTSFIDGFIVNVNQEILKHKLELKICKLGQLFWTSSEVVFEGVSSCLFFEDSSLDRFKKANCLADVGDKVIIYDFLHTNKENFSYVKKDYKYTPNFVLDLGSQAFFIEANKIIIDGEEFNVGYPHENK